MSRITRIEVTQGGVYGAYEPIQWTVTTPISSIVFQIDFLGETINKRVLARNGKCVLLFSDILDKIKKNIFEFKPFSIYGIGAFETLEVFYDDPTGFYEIDFKISNALVSPSNSLLTKDFLTPQKNIYYDNRFECGLFFAGVTRFRYTTDRGEIEQEVGVEGDLSFQSFRDISFTLSDAAVKVNGRGREVQNGTTLYGFEDGGTSGLTFYGSGPTFTTNAEQNIVTFTGSGVITSMQLSDGETVSFETGLSFGKSTTNPTNIFFLVDDVGDGNSDNSLYLGQREGVVKFDTGEVIPNFNRNAQIEV